MGCRDSDPPLLNAIFRIYIYIYKTVRVMRVSGLSSLAKYFLFFNINMLKNDMFEC